MVTEYCERLWEVDALREGRLGATDVESFERHRRGCSACHTRFAEDERLRELGRMLAPPESSELEARRVRAAILKSAAAPHPRRHAWIAVFAAAAVVLAVATWAAIRGASGPADLAARGGSSAGASAAPTEFAATVSPAPNTRWQQERESGLERVRLTEGALSLSVRHQREVERFVVAMPDGEIEVRGTAFDVDVQEGRTTRVVVREGLVALRLHGHEEILLGAGEAWPRAIASTATGSPSAGAAPSNATPPRRPATAPPAATSSAPPDSPEQDDYARAIALYKAHQYQESARAFHALAGSGGHAEDAAFLEASSLAFAGNAAGAAAAAASFLARFPASFHAREASILVARAARDGGDCATARHALERWMAAQPSADLQRALGRCAP